MTEFEAARRYRFGAFEADSAAGELRRRGLRIKLNAQPFQVLLLLLDRAGEVLTRGEIERELWPEGTFVDFEHGVNSAINRIREALGDTAGNPRFVETLARRGYRFVAPVEKISAGNEAPKSNLTVGAEPAAASEPAEARGEPLKARREPIMARRSILASTQELPETSYPVVQTLFISFQLMYLGFYIGALANLAEIEDLLSPLSHAGLIFTVMIVSAAILIPVRAFVLCAVLFHAPGVREKFLKLWPVLLAFDILWSLSPFLLLHHINVGLALSCTALLVYAPFVQRALVLMGAGSRKREV